MEPTRYKSNMPSCVEAGPGCRGGIGDLLAGHGAKRALVFSDSGVVNAGLAQPILRSIEAAGVAYRLAGFVDPEPAYAQVQQVCDDAKAFAPDIVVAMGGGSVMDTAKLYTLLHGAAYTVKDLLAQPGIGAKQLPSVMLPTTCGTGSEATPNAIVAVPEDGVKVGVVNPAMIPDQVLLDPELLAGLPPALVAATGVDALAHAVECYTSNKANPLSDAYALHSARLIFQNLRAACGHPDDLAAKEAMLVGAYFGGAAITASGTTAVHALSYPLGGSFHIPHGVSNAILFAPVMAFNRDACEDRMAALCDAVNPALVGESARRRSTWLVEEIAAIVRDTGIPENLRGFGVTADNLDFLTEAAGQVTRLLGNNRKVMIQDDIRAIYAALV